MNGPYGVSADVMDTYVKSCAGYCVITYLLGMYVCIHVCMYVCMYIMEKNNV